MGRMGQPQFSSCGKGTLLCNVLSVFHHEFQNFLDESEHFESQVCLPLKTSVHDAPPHIPWPLEPNF